MSSWFTECECMTDEALLCHENLDDCECDCGCDDCDDIL